MAKAIQAYRVFEALFCSLAVLCISIPAVTDFFKGKFILQFYYLSPGLTGFFAMCLSERNIEGTVLMAYLNRKSSLKSYNLGIIGCIPSDVNLSRFNKRHIYELS